MEIKNKNAMDAWSFAMQTIIEKGVFISSDSKATREILNLAISISGDEDSFQFPVEEIAKVKKWIYPTASDIKDFLFSKEPQVLGKYSYGERIFKWDGVKNQVDDYIIPLLLANPTSRRAIVTLYNPRLDSDMNNKEIPAIMDIFFRVSENKLYITATMRSSEFLLGWPANLCQIKFLQEYVCEKTGFPCGDLTLISYSAHINEENICDAKNILEKLNRK